MKSITKLLTRMNESDLFRYKCYSIKINGYNSGVILDNTGVVVFDFSNKEEMETILNNIEKELDSDNRDQKWSL